MYSMLNMGDFSVLTGLLGYLDSTQKLKWNSLHAQTRSFLLLNLYLRGNILPFYSKSVGQKKALRMEEFEK
jgi:hypothetical protein